MRLMARSLAVPKTLARTLLTTGLSFLRWGRGGHGRGREPLVYAKRVGVERVWGVQMANAVAQCREAHWAAGGRMVHGVLKAARDAAGRRVSLGVAGVAEMCGGRMNP